MSTIKVKDGDSSDKYFGVFGVGSETFPFQNSFISQGVSNAILEVKNSHGVDISVQQRAKSLIKFGVNNDIDAGIRETIWSTGGNETYQTSNTIDRVVSSDAGDTQSIVIEGHTLSGGLLTFVTQTVTLTGTTAVTLATPLARANRLYNNGSSDFLGNVTVYVNGGTTHITANGAENQSLKGATSISDSEYYLITDLTFSVNRTNTAVCDFELQSRIIGKVFRTIAPKLTCSDTEGTIQVHFEQPIIIRNNSDVRLMCTSSAANTFVSGAMHGYLASIV
jgi:hypothetical protein